MTSFGAFVGAAHASGRLIVQPRMGFSDPAVMRRGLAAVKAASASAVGTVTLDSYTRTGEYEAVRQAIASGVPLNGYPIVHHDADTTRAVLEGVRDAGFPVQVRHGSARPMDIFASMIEVGLDAVEGGPVSYCLPYGRTPLREALRSWEECCALLAGVEHSHLESFGGCMMGQLCPPSLLVAISVLEAMFFRQHGIRSISLSYAQQTNPEQDEEAVLALRRLAAELLPDVERHVVIYTYMGVYPRTAEGAMALGDQAARLAVRTGAARLIVKTAAEAFRIPTISDNVAALERAARVAAKTKRLNRLADAEDSAVYLEARVLVECVLDIGSDIGRALVTAFENGYLDVPFCLHPDNAQLTRSAIDANGRLVWTDIGRMPIRGVVPMSRTRRMTSSELLTSLSYVERKFDLMALQGAAKELQ